MALVMGTVARFIQSSAAQIGTTAALRVAKQVTSRIPIVMTPSADPIVAGIVQSIAHPGGNVTGITEMAPELTPKRLEMLKDTQPGGDPVAAWLLK
jgi:putative ABC transport system substrate-binding protein